MSRWTLFFLVAFLSLGFAPAPFPRPGRRGADQQAVSLAHVQGTWEILKLEHTTATGPVDKGKSLKAIRIENNRWSFLHRTAGVRDVVYDLAVDGSKKPATFDLMRQGQQQPYGMGLLVRQGDDMQVLYSFTNGRPPTFAPLPAGYVLLTLRRQR
jgi:uncharacterized protein (TIGR03067 family)